MKISLVMIVKNEENNLPMCLESVRTLVDEIIIVDTGSTDATKDIAFKFNAKVFDFKWNNNFAEARNFAISKSTGDWNLFLDADETLLHGTKEDLIRFAQNNARCVGRIFRVNKFEDNGEINTSNEYISRFAPKQIQFSGIIHEQLDVTLPRENVSLAINHSGYFQTDKSTRNLKLLQVALQKNPNDVYMLYQMAKTLFVSKNYKEADSYFKRCEKNIKANTPYTLDCLTSYVYNCAYIKDFVDGVRLLTKYGNIYTDSADFNFAAGVFYTEMATSNIDNALEYLYKVEESYFKCIDIGDTNSIVEGVGSYKAAYNLGLLYEIVGNNDNAIHYYKESSRLGYNLAAKRLLLIEKNKK